MLNQLQTHVSYDVIIYIALCHCLLNAMFSSFVLWLCIHNHFYRVSAGETFSQFFYVMIPHSAKDILHDLKCLGNQWTEVQPHWAGFAVHEGPCRKNIFGWFGNTHYKGSNVHIPHTLVRIVHTCNYTCHFWYEIRHVVKGDLLWKRQLLKMESNMFTSFKGSF